ncbi:MAG: extracellular elastinolytic metalloproteinase, partial [Crocinitomicaceae bacterium]
AGIDENTLTGVSISPNPSNGIMTISTSSNVESGIAVYDMIGNVVHTSNMNAETTVDLSTLGAGVYLVKISNENGSAVERVVIK